MMQRWGRRLTAWAVACTVAAGLVGATPTAAGAAPGERRLTGTVTSDLGAPIPGARVRLYQDGVGYLAHFADTAADGAWAIEGMPAGSYRVSISDPTLAHVAEWWGDTTLRSASTPVAVGTTHDEDLDVALTRAGTVAGTIAAPGAFDVYLYAGDPATTSATKVLTGQVGTFSFGGLAPGAYRVLVKDPAGTLADLWYPNRGSRAEALPIPVAAGQVATAVYRHTQLGTGTVEGVVIDSEGPVAGVVVQVYSATSGTLLRSARTDAEGQYRVTIPAGCYKPFFRDPTGGHVTAYPGSDGVIGNVYGPCLRSGDAQTYDQELEITSTLAGVVTDGETALAGIKVAVYRDGSTARIVTTDGDGGWSAVGLEPGTYTVGYSDPARAFVPEYHGDASRRAEAEPIELEQLYGVDVEAVLARR